jgi:DNA topoisomerase IB
MVPAALNTMRLVIPKVPLFQDRVRGIGTHRIDSGDVNGYIRQLTGHDFTAKDFRTGRRPARRARTRSRGAFYQRHGSQAGRRKRRENRAQGLRPEEYSVMVIIAKHQEKLAKVA